MNLTEIFKKMFRMKDFKIEQFQKEKEITPSGKIDDSTFRRLETEKEFQEGMQNSIICNGVPVPVTGFRVVQKPLPSSCYKIHKTQRIPKFITCHWDVALSSSSCFNILKSRGISSHFSIDNVDISTGEAVIYQFVDTNHIAYHAGPVTTDIDRLKKKGINAKGVSWNGLSIGIDLSNAYYLKYNSWYEKNVGIKRPEITSKCHGQTLNHLGYYPEQIKALTALLDALCNHYSIPFEYPKLDNGDLVSTVDRDSAEGKFRGVVNHYNLTYNKIDCSGLDLKTILTGLKKDNES